MENESSFEEVLSRDGRLAYTNVGFSMRPLIREGKDVMIIEKRDVSALKKYDAVLFRRQNIKGRGEYVLHRILKILSDGSFYIVGDNCTEGEIVKPSQILGVLSGLYREGKPIDMDSFKYKIYITFWCAPYPFRFFVLRTKRFIRRCLGAILYKFKSRR